MDSPDHHRPAGAQPGHQHRHRVDRPPRSFGPECYDVANMTITATVQSPAEQKYRRASSCSRGSSAIIAAYTLPIAVNQAVPGLGQFA